MKTLGVILKVVFQAIFIALGVILFSELDVMLFFSIIEQHQRIWG